MKKKRFAFLSSKPARVAVIIIGVFLMFFGGVIWNNASVQRQNALDPIRGQINPQYKIDPSQPIFIFMGGAGSNFTAQELANGINVSRFVSFGDFTFPLQITFGQDGNIQVSTVIADEKGNILANVIDNEWKAPTSGSTQIWDKNYNSYAFEVLDSNKIPVLQIIIGEKNELLIGISLYHQGIPYFGTIPTGFNFFGDYYINGLTTSQLEDLRNATIFNYPSSDHLGELRLIPDYSTFPPTFKIYPSEDLLASSAQNSVIGATMVITGGLIDAFVTIDTIKGKGKKH